MSAQQTGDVKGTFQGNGLGTSRVAGESPAMNPLTGVRFLRYTPCTQNPGMSGSCMSQVKQSVQGAGSLTSLPLRIILRNATEAAGIFLRTACKQSKSLSSRAGGSGGRGGAASDLCFHLTRG